MPQLASLNSLVLYPTEVATLLLPMAPSTFYALDLILHLWLAAMAMRWWLRRLGCTEGGAFTGGLLYMLGGHLFTLAAAGHPHWIRCLAGLPVMLAALEGYPDGGWRGGFLAGAVLALDVLGASMHFVLLAVPVGVVWALAAGAWPVKARAERVAAFLAVPVLLGATVWIPGFEYYQQSVRRAPGPGSADAWSLTSWDIPALVVPGLWGSARAYWGPHLFRASGDYPGLIAIALAGVGFAARWRAEARFALLGAAGVLLSLGSGTPAGALLDQVPGYSGLRVPLRWLSFSHVSLCILAARGWDEVAAGRAWRTAAGGLAAVAAFCAVGVAMERPLASGVARLPFVADHVREGRVPEKDVRERFGGAARDGFIRAAAGAASLAGLGAGPGGAVWRTAQSWVVAAADLETGALPFFQYGDSRAASAPDPVASELIRRVPQDSGRVATDEYFGLPNRRMPLGIEFTWGYHGLPLARYSAIHEAAAATGSLPILSALSVRVLVTGIRPAPSWPRAVEIAGAPEGSAWVIDNPASISRAWLAVRSVPVRDVAEAVAIMRRPGWTPELVPVEVPPGVDPPPGAGRPRGRNEVTMARGVDELAADLELDRGGLVVFSEVWYPAWKAFVDGRRTRIWCVCGTLRGVEVPAGRHRVRMLYDTWTTKIGLWLSMLGWTMAVWIARKRLFR